MFLASQTIDTAHQAAAALGESPSRVLKTLIAEVDTRPVCLVLASDREASMKKVALAFGGRRATGILRMPAAGPASESVRPAPWL